MRCLRCGLFAGILLTGFLYSVDRAEAQNFDDPAIERVESLENGARRVVVESGATWTVRIGSGETLSDLLVDIDRPGADFHAFASGTGWTIRNLGVKGTIKSRYALVTEGENGTVENVYLGDGAEDGTQVMGVWIDHDDTEGPLDFRKVHISGYPNNGIYGSPTVEEDRGGIVNIYDSYFDSNNISNFKLGSPLGPCEVVNTVIRTDNSATPNSRGQVNKRGMWALDNPGGGHPNRHRVILRDSDFLGRIVTEPGAIVELQNTRWDGTFQAGDDVHESGDPPGELVGSSAGEPDLTPPDGVPMNAREAATGSTSEPSNEQPEPLISVPKVAESVAIDGRLDEPDWGAAPVLEFTDEEGASDNTARVRGLWTADALYFGWRIEDGSVESYPSEAPYREDSVEFYLDPENNAGSDLNSDDLHVVVSTEKQVLAKIGGEEAEEKLGLESRVREVDDGYVVEMKIDWSALAASPESGLALGALFANGDRDDGTAIQYAEPPITPFAQPRLWEPIELAGPSSNLDDETESESDAGDSSEPGSSSGGMSYGDEEGSGSSDGSNQSGAGADAGVGIADTEEAGPSGFRDTDSGCSMTGSPRSLGGTAWLAILAFIGVAARHSPLATRRWPLATG